MRDGDPGRWVHVQLGSRALGAIMDCVMEVNAGT